MQMKSFRNWRLAGIVVGAILSAANAQVNLRPNIVHSDDNVSMTCGVEMTISGERHAVIGDASGTLTFYRYTPNSSPITRVGRVMTSRSRIDDFAAQPIASGQQLVAVASGRVYVMDYTGSDILPWGFVALPSSPSQSAVRVAVNGNEIAIATSASVAQQNFVHIYNWTNPAQYGTLDQSISAPIAQTLNIPAPITTLRYASPNVLLVGARNGMVYAFQRGASGFTLSGKAMQQFTPVVEMVVNGNDLAVACADGYVYVWDWTTRSYRFTLKDRWFGNLEAHCLTSLPDRRLAVGSASVRVYSFQNGALLGVYGSPLSGETYSGNLGNCVTPIPNLRSTRLFPTVANNSYFVMGSSSYFVPAVAFVQSPSQLFYRSVAYTMPVYALDSARSLNRVWAAYADGNIVRRDASLQSPVSFSAGAPVFAVREIRVNDQPVLLFSWGAQGAVSARSGGDTLTVIPPSDTTARIIYDLAPVGDTFAANAPVQLLTVSSNGMLELWRWNAGSNQPATLVASRSVTTSPLWRLSLNSNTTRAAVAGSRGVWTVPLSLSSQNPLGSATSVSTLVGYDVAFHPTDADLLAISMGAVNNIGFFVQLHHLSNPSLTGNLTGYFYFYPYEDTPSNPFLLKWRDAANLVCAPLYGDFVYVCDTTRPKSISSGGTRSDYLPFALQEAYELSRDGFFALDIDPDGVMTVGSADGGVFAWNAVGKPVFRTYLNSTLERISFLPVNGQIVYRHHWTPFQGQGIHACLVSNGFLLGMRNPDSNTELRALGFFSPRTSYYQAAYYSPDASGAQLTRITSGTEYLINLTGYDVSEDGRWAFVPNSASVTNNNLTISYRRVGHTGGDGVVIQPSAFNGAGTAYTPAVAASPSGNRFAIGVSTVTEVKIGTFSNNAWSWASIDREASGTLSLEFLTEDVLMLAYSRNNRIYVELFERTGSTWTQRQSFDTGLPAWGSTTFKMIDAVTVSGQTRVALAAWSGLLLYRLSFPGGQASLVEVARSTQASNANLLLGRVNWVQFSRFNPNYLGVANGGIETAVFDVSGLPWQ